MDMEDQESASSTTENTGVPETSGESAPESTGSEALPPAGADPAVAAHEAAAEAGAASVTAATDTAYKPNYGFKVKDKEFQFEDWAKGAIKDAVSEKKIREFHEKAYGLEDVKADRQTIKQQLQETTNKYKNLEGSVNYLSSLVKNKDYGKFFQTLQVPKEDVLRYAVEEFKYQELPPEQKAQIDAQREREEQFQLLQQQTASQQQQLQQYTVQQKGMELNGVLSRPEITAVASSYDARVGKPGAFQQEVINRGAYYEKLYGITPTAQQVVDEIVALTGIQATQASAPNPMLPQGNAGSSSPTQNKPVIPAFAGQGGRTPTKKVFTSIEQLRKHRATINGSADA